MHRRCLLFLAGILATETIAGAAAAVDTQIPKTKFSCSGRSSGYYADVDSGCQVYHMCDGLGRQFSYTCPNATLFQQRMLICDHWYMVNCSKSEDDYAANLRIGQREMPFVDDSESHPYHRTPRPDLLSHHSQSEYDIIYRTGKAYMGNNLNLVGVESDTKNSSTSTTDEPTYSLPSHWSTEYSQQFTTSKPNFVDKLISDKKKIENLNIVTGQPFAFTTESSIVNFESSYKATTPVFPETVVTESSDELKLLPPLPYHVYNKTYNSETLTEISTNFKSLFKATTPVYPASVDLTSEEPSDVGLLPPPAPNSSDSANNVTHNNIVSSVNLEIKSSSIDRTLSTNGSENTSEIPPSKYYQPPKFGDNNQSRKDEIKMLDNENWVNLRKKYFIPDYEFPLESVSRPSYDSLLSSFQVNSGPPENVIKVTKEAA